MSRARFVGGLRCCSGVEGDKSEVALQSRCVAALRSDAVRKSLLGFPPASYYRPVTNFVAAEVPLAEMAYSSCYGWLFWD